MWFRRGPSYQQNRVVRLFAGLALMGITGFALPLYSPWLLLPCTGIGFGIMVYQGWKLWQERSDPYDLARLEQIHNARQEPDELPPGNAIYCHRCGTAMPDNRAICPECGSFLGT